MPDNITNFNFHKTDAKYSQWVLAVESLSSGQSFDLSDEMADDIAQVTKITIAELPSNNETFDINDVTITFKTSSPSGDDEVLIGSDEIEQASLLTELINSNATLSADLLAEWTDGDDFFYLTAKSPGVPFDVTESLAALTIEEITANVTATIIPTSQQFAGTNVKKHLVVNHMITNLNKPTIKTIVVANNGNIVADTSTITVGSTSYLFKASGATDNQINKGGSASATATNIVTKLLADFVNIDEPLLDNVEIDADDNTKVIITGLDNGDTFTLSTNAPTAFTIATAQAGVGLPLISFQVWKYNGLAANFVMVYEGNVDVGKSELRLNLHGDSGFVVYPIVTNATIDKCLIKMEVEL